MSIVGAGFRQQSCVHRCVYALRTLNFRHLLTAHFRKAAGLETKEILEEEETLCLLSFCFALEASWPHLLNFLTLDENF